MERRQTHRIRWMERFVLLLIIVLISSLSLAACTTGQEAAEPEVANTPMVEPTEQVETPEEADIGFTDGGATLSAIADNPDAYIGQTVAIRGEVSTVISPQTFRMNENNLLDIGDEVLVIHQPLRVPLKPEVNIQVTGGVRTFVLADIEQEFDFDLQDDLYVDYENRPVIVANTIATAATVSDIADNPDAYVGLPVSVVGEVTELVGQRAFRLNDPAELGGDSVLVVSSQPDLTLDVVETVGARGVVRQFVLTDIEDEVGFDLDDALFTDYENQSVIVADRVNPAAGVEENEANAGEAATGDAAAEDAAPTDIAPADVETEQPVSLSAIADNPDAYIGQTATVTGEVSTVISPQAFRMNENNLLDIGDEVLVIHQPLRVTLDPEVNIQVAGDVRTFVLADIEQEFDFDLQDDLYVDYENRPVIVANTIAAAATVSDIADNPDAYAGLPVSVVGEVTELVGQRAFRLDDPALLGGDDLLVVSTYETLPIVEGDTVRVTGPVRQFVLADIENEIGFDLEDNLFTDFENRTVIVAQRVAVALPSEPTTISDIAEDPAAFVGQQVTVGGEVSEVLAPEVFRMDEGNLLDTGDEILVIQSGVAPGLQDGTELQVTGEMRNFVRTELESDFGFDFLDNEQYTDFEGQPVIVASDVHARATLSEVDDNPENYLGMSVTVAGDVTNIVGPNSFRLNDQALLGGDDVLVISANPAITVNEGDTIDVTGQVRTLVLSDVEQEFDLDLEDDLYTDFENRTVIVANRVTQTME